MTETCGEQLRKSETDMELQVRSPAEAGSLFSFGIAGSGVDMRHSAPFGPGSQGCFLE